MVVMKNNFVTVCNKHFFSSSSKYYYQNSLRCSKTSFKNCSHIICLFEQGYVCCVTLSLIPLLQPDVHFVIYNKIIWLNIAQDNHRFNLSFNSQVIHDIFSNLLKKKPGIVINTGSMYRFLTSKYQRARGKVTRGMQTKAFIIAQLFWSFLVCMMGFYLTWRVWIFSSYVI